MSIQPQELAVDIFHRLHNYSVDPDSVNEFDIRRIENDAKKLLTHDALSAYTALGCISYLKHDTQAMLNYHSTAVKLNKHEYLSSSNFAVSLCNTGRYAEAVKYSRVTVDVTGRSDSDILIQHCSHLVSAGLFSEAYECVKQLDTMHVKVKHASIIKNVVDLIDEYDIDEESISQYFTSVTDVLNKYDIYPKGEAIWDYDEESYSVVREVYIDEPVETVAKMNQELSEVIVKKGLPEEVLSIFCSLFIVGRLNYDIKGKAAEVHVHRV